MLCLSSTDDDGSGDESCACSRSGKTDGRDEADDVLLPGSANTGSEAAAFVPSSSSLRGGRDGVAGTLPSAGNDGSMGEVSTCSSSDTTGSYSSTMDDSNEAEDTGDVCSGGGAPAGSSSETVGGGDEATGAGSNCSSDETSAGCSSGAMGVRDDVDGSSDICSGGGATAGSSSGSCFGTAVVAGFSTAHLRGARGCFGTDTTAGRAAPCLGTIGRDDEVDGVLLGSGEGCSTRDDSASQNCFTDEK